MIRQDRSGTESHRDPHRPARPGAPAPARPAVGIGRGVAQALIRVYQLTFSGLAGRQCRHWPTCSDYASEAIARHGVWAGSWMGAARICRCGPLGTHGIDLVCEEVPAHATWYMPWRYARWRAVNAPAGSGSS